ncbi:MAG: hypothetical protein EXQ84_05295 [Rhodospirillaceae bacterium]|nr:hypothetical protein [Rhodospirillaceae bacterium]
MKHQGRWRAALAMAITLVSGTAGAADSAGKLVFENARVTIREVTGAVGAPLPVDAALDAVTVDISSGKLDFLPKGAPRNASAPKLVAFELKEGKVAPLANTSGYPDAFPRPAVKKVFENARIVAWDYTWTPAMPPPTHFHTKDVVVVYLADGTLQSIAPNGEKTLAEHTYGSARFQSSGRLHTEDLVKGTARAIVIELN